MTLSVRECEEMDLVMTGGEDSTDQVQAVSTLVLIPSLLDESILFGFVLGREQRVV